MPLHGPARLEERDGRPTLVFERVLPYPPERVWRALTRHEELYDWHPTPFRFEPVVGGKVEFLPTPEGPSMPAGEVRGYEPPTLLAYSWGEDELRFELRPHEQGSVLTLLHSFDDRYKAARDAAGWETCLTVLSERLAEDRPRARGDGPRLPPGDWRRVNSEYELRFGIPPERATPPPKTEGRGF